jgi:hypothetical protein
MTNKGGGGSGRWQMTGIGLLVMEVLLSFNFAAILYEIYIFFRFLSDE